MLRHPRLSPLLAALLLLSAAARAAAVPGPPLPPLAIARAGELDEVVDAARALPRGGRLVVEELLLGPDGPAVAVGVERVRVWSEDAEIVVHRAAGEERHTPPDTAWMLGTLVGESDSRVVLAVPGEGPPRGLLFRGGRTYVLGAEGEDVARGRGGLVARQARTPPGAPFDCQLGDLAPPEELLGAFADAPPPVELRHLAEAATTPTHTARVAVETDWELFQRFGSAAALTDYVGDLFASISALYSEEIATTLEVSHLSIWDSPADPWTQPLAACALFELGRYWNQNRGAIEYSIAHFLSGKQTGGIAFVGALCSDEFNYDHRGLCPELSPQLDAYGGPYGFTGWITGSFDPAAPTIVWDLVSVAHEIGHNFNSPHTHCYGGLGGSPAPIDLCWTGECTEGCYCGRPSLPCSTRDEACGTVMSYCHMRSGGFDNIAFTLGAGHPFGVQPERVPARMRAHVLERAASAPACLPLSDGGGDCDDLALSELTISGAEEFSTCGTLFAGPDVEVGAAGELTLTGSAVVLRDGFSVAAGGELLVLSLP
jgi:hypothetical protein